MKKKLSTILAALLIFAGLTVLDQYTKVLAVRFLADGTTVPILPGIFELRYTENHGAAFGILQNHQIFFYILTAAVILAVLWLFLFRIPSERRFFPLNGLCVLILAGALGNLIDRVRQSYVVDFLYFRLIDFPIFNVADCYVTVSCFLLILLILFYYKDEDLKGILW